MLRRKLLSWHSWTRSGGFYKAFHGAMQPSCRPWCRAVPSIHLRGGQGWEAPRQKGLWQWPSYLAALLMSSCHLLQDFFLQVGMPPPDFWRCQQTGNWRGSRLQELSGSLPHCSRAHPPSCPAAASAIAPGGTWRLLMLRHPSGTRALVSISPSAQPRE